MTKINTSKDEFAPYMCPDNKTLIFSSNRKGGFGGYDFYYTILDSNGEWSEPKNLGEPFNADDDDEFISFNGACNIAYFCSDRTDIEGSQGLRDIYIAYLSEPFCKDIRTISWQQFNNATVTINIYDDNGNAVITINMKMQKAGRHSFQWNGFDSSGKACASGKYSFEVSIGDGMPEPQRVLRIK